MTMIRVGDNTFQVKDFSFEYTTPKLEDEWANFVPPVVPKEFSFNVKLIGRQAGRWLRFIKEWRDREHDWLVYSDWLAGSVPKSNYFHRYMTYTRLSDEDKLLADVLVAFPDCGPVLMPAGRYDYASFPSYVGWEEAIEREKNKLRTEHP